MDAIPLPCIDQWPDLCLRIESRADPQRSHDSCNAVDELIGNWPRDEKPLRSDAHLTAVAELGGNRTGGELLEIDVGKNKHGCVAAELQRQPRHRFRRAIHQSLPDRQAAGEMNLRACGVS